MGAKGGSFARLKHRYLLGLLLMAAGFIAAGLAPVYEVAAVMFALAGLGNGLLLVHERLLIQDSVAHSIMGRVFGVKDALTAWAFALAFLAAGGLLELVGPGHRNRRGRRRRPGRVGRRGRAPARRVDGRRGPGGCPRRRRPPGRARRSGRGSRGSRPRWRRRARPPR